MDVSRLECILRLEGLDDHAVASACHTALTLVAADVVQAETDIPWSERDRWPWEVVEAATRLCDRFVPEVERHDDYRQTGVRSVADSHVREDFITFAPYAYDATFWDDSGEVASLADEGLSFAIWLTRQQRGALREAIGAERVISVVERRRAHPSLWRKWRDRLTSRP